LEFGRFGKLHVQNDSDRTKEQCQAMRDAKSLPMAKSFEIWLEIQVE
jgi:hypothetical protein